MPAFSVLGSNISTLVLGRFLLVRCDVYRFLAFHCFLTTLRTNNEAERPKNNNHFLTKNRWIWQLRRTAYSQYSPHMCDSPNAVSRFHTHWYTVPELRQISPSQACPCRLSARRVIMYVSFVARLEVAWMAEPVACTKSIQLNRHGRNFSEPTSTEPVKLRYGGHCLGSGDGQLSIEVVDSDDMAAWFGAVMSWPCSPRRHRHGGRRLAIFLDSGFKHGAKQLVRRLCGLIFLLAWHIGSLRGGETTSIEL